MHMGFDEFRKAFESWAQRELRDDRPKYVHAFEAQRSTDLTDLDAAILAARPFQGAPLKWASLLTRTLDVDMARDRLRLATDLCGSETPDEDFSLGVWVNYTTDAWWLAAMALIDRFDKLAVAICRRFVTDTVKQKQEIQSLRSAWKDWRDRIKKIRDSVAHGGGPVEALEEDRLWEVHLALRIDGFDELVQQFHESSAGKQTEWHHRLSSATGALLGALDGWSDQLMASAFP